MSGLYQRKSQSVGSLLDTDLTNPINTDVLTYENELWKNKPVAGTTNISFRATSPVATGFTFTSGSPLFSAQLDNVIGNKGSFNIGGGYNPATGLFTAPETGVYSFTGSVFWETSSFVANYVRVMITTPTLITHANALISNQYGANETFNANFTQVVTGILSLTAGDTIGIYVNANNASPTNIALISRQYSYFCGHKI